MSDEKDKQPPTPTDRLVKELESFLTSSEPDVLCIRGQWGVGKTFLWNDVLMRVKDRIALSHYSYVTLFGLNELDKLRYAIFENRIPREKIGVEPSLDTFKDNFGTVVSSWTKRGLTIFERVPGAKNAIEALQAASFLAVGKQVICIDDLERKGDKLRVIDILGQISQLRERRRCKIVLILNEEELSDEDKKAFDKYQEKVIETSVVFAPTPEECARIAVKGNETSAAFLRTNAIKLGISNIRVISKIRRLIDKVKPVVSRMNPLVLEQIVRSLVLFGWVHFAKPGPKDGPLISDFVFKKRGRGLYGLTSDKSLTETEVEWDGLLDRYGFGTADDLDTVLYEGVANGFFDEEKIIALASIIHENLKNSKELEAWRAAWAAFRGPFADNEDDIVKNLLAAYQPNITRIAVSEVDYLCTLLREFDRADKVATVVQAYVDANKDQPRNFWNPEDVRAGTNIVDPELRTAFDARFASLQIVRTPKEILMHIYKHEGWESEDIDTLVNTTVENYVAMFKSITDSADVRAVAKTALDFDRLISEDDRYKTVASIVADALKRIASENRLNRRRVLNLGVKLDS